MAKVDKLAQARGIKRSLMEDLENIRERLMIIKKAETPHLDVHYTGSSVALAKLSAVLDFVENGIMVTEAA